MNRMKYLNKGGLEEQEKEMYERKAEMSRMNDFMKGGLK
jgi:hypothetical protein